MSVGRKSSSIARKAEERPAVSSWQLWIRILATLANTAMVVYIYAAHLAGVEWSGFGRYRALEVGQSRSIRDYVFAWDAAFDHLRVFTFSEAILENLVVYVVIGAPVAVMLVVVERNRVRWLQSLVAKNFTQELALRSNRLLEGYLWMFGTMLFLIVLVGPLHLDMPRAHYACVACALTCGVNTMLLYLAATAQLAATAATTKSDEMIAWARQQCWVRRVIKTNLLLHGAAGVAAAWKAESLGDDWPALIFGLVETLLILSYQAWAMVLSLDDMTAMRGKAAAAPAQEPLKISPRSEIDAMFDRMIGS